MCEMGVTNATGVKQLLKNKANVPHREAILADSKPHAKNYCRVAFVTPISHIGEDDLLQDP